MIDHFTPPAFFKTVRGMEHEQLFTEFNVSAAHNLSLSSEVRMRAEYNILEKRKWRTLAKEKNTLLKAKDKEIEDLKSQLLKARDESAEVTQLHAQVSSLEATENPLRGEVASAKDRHTLLEQECLFSLSLRTNVHELEVSSTVLHEKLEMYEEFLKWLEEYQDNLMEPLRTRLAEIDADFTRLLNSNEYMAGLQSLLGRAIEERGCRRLSSAGIEAWASWSDAFHKKDASTWDIMDLLRLDDAVAKTLGMTDLQPDASQLMVPVHHKQDKVIIGSQALSVALDICRGRVEKMERNLIERLPFLKGVFASIDDPLSAQALIEPPAEVPATNMLSTVVIVPHADPSVSVEDYDNPDSTDVVPENVILGLESKGKIDAHRSGYVSQWIMVALRMCFMSVFVFPRWGGAV
ncbi:hypothetical protein Tco_1562400 [Tanacetum coccineum]